MIMSEIHIKYVYSKCKEICKNWLSEVIISSDECKIPY